MDHRGDFKFKGPWANEDIDFPFTLSLEFTPLADEEFDSTTSIQINVAAKTLIGQFGEIVELKGSMDACCTARCFTNMQCRSIGRNLHHR